MSWIRQIFSAISRGIKSFLGDLKMFASDVSKNAYKQVVNYAAIGLLGIGGALLLFFGGTQLYEWYNREKNQAQYFVTRQISGEVRDQDSDVLLSNISVGVVGEPAFITTTGETGRFVLQFRAHRDSLYVEIGFKGAYYTETKRVAIPLDEASQNEFQVFTLKADASALNE